MKGMVYLSNERLRDLGYSRYALEQLLTLSVTDYSGKTTELKQAHSTDGGLYVPRAFMDGEFYDPNAIESGPKIDLDDEGAITLRDYQEEAVNAVYRQTINEGGAVLIGGCGTGKTIMGCFLIKMIGERALVLVHKEFLMQQFKQSLEMAFPSIKVGIWQRDSIPDGTEDVVISMVQSITSREYDDSLYEGFGLIVTDEVHRFSAPLWSGAIERFGARYRIGLTATPDRSDGLERVFFNHIGKIAHTVTGNLLTPKIYPIELRGTYSKKAYSAWDGSVSTSKLITCLAKDDERSDVIADYAVRALLTDRSVLVLCDRREHVEYLRHATAQLIERHIDEGNLTAEHLPRVYLGGLKKEAREHAESGRLIIGTYSMAQEGLDIPRLDTLLFASPKSNIVQAVGRILRPHESKKSPVVLDFVDVSVGILNGYYKKRKRLYAENNYVLTPMKLSV